MSRRKKVEPQAARLRLRTVGYLIAAASIALVALAPLWWNSPSRSSSRSANVVPVPDPDTTGFEAPVREIIAQARRGVVDHPTSLDAWGWLATVLDAHLFSSHAEIAYRRALELAPNDPVLSYNLAVLLESLGGDPDESLSLYRGFAHSQPDFPPVYVRIGRILAVEGQLKAAAEAYRTALKFDPGLAFARRSLAQVLIALGDETAAAAELERVEAVAPKDGPTLAALAQVYARLGQGARASEATRRGRESSDELNFPDPVQFQVKQQGRSARMASLRAADKVRDADYAGALEDLKIVLLTRSRDPRIHDRVAEAYQHLGQSALAEEHLAEARRLRGER
jgi:predicted Zn-dependent protease